MKTIYEVVRKVSGKATSFSAKAPSKTKQGDPILDHETLAEM